MLRRFAGLAATALAIVTLSFVLLRLAPGGPFDEERSVAPSTEVALRAYFGLDDPIATQYLRYLGNLVRGDLGPSLKYRGRSVGELLAAGLPASAALGLLALALALASGLVLGALAALWRGRALDRLASVLTAGALSLPSFLIGALLLAVFALWLRVLPAGGFGTPAHLVLPAVALAIPHAATIARLTRTSLVETLAQDFVRTARAKGLSEAEVVARHALRPALLPVIAHLGPAAAGLFTGSLAVESIFNIPGIGAYFVNGALNRDYTLVMGAVVVGSVVLLAFNALADGLCALADPRLRSPASGPSQSRNRPRG